MIKIQLRRGQRHRSQSRYTHSETRINGWIRKKTRLGSSRRDIYAWNMYFSPIRFEEIVISVNILYVFLFDR